MYIEQQQKIQQMISCECRQHGGNLLLFTCVYFPHLIDTYLLENCKLPFYLKL